MAHPSDSLQRLRAEEPFVRALARALVQGDADDVVQQTWLRVLERRPHGGDAGPGGAGRGGAGPADPRAWLARVVRNLVADGRRRDQRRRAREREAAAPERVSSSAELLLGEERRRALVLAVDALPPPLRTVVLMRWYDGLPPRRIAAALGLPVTTVWNRLHAALQELRQRLDDDHGGDRRAWLVPLVPFASAPRSLPWREVLTGAGNGLGLGGLVMTAKTKTMAAAAVLVVAAVAWMVWPAAADLPAVPPAGSGERALAAATGEVPPSGNAVTPSEPAQRAPVADDPTAAPTTGTLVVHVRYPDEPHEAAGLEVALGEQGGDFRVGLRHAVTDEHGTARFDGVPPREWLASVSRAGGFARATVRPGETVECTMQLRDGIDVTGIVVDEAGVGVAGAVVELATPATVGMDSAPVTTTRADGTFVLRSAHENSLIGARAPGRAASKLHYVSARHDLSQPLRIELSRPGGSVTGIVLGTDGAPVRDAVVRVGEGRTDGLRSNDQGAAPLPAQVRTDEAGRFSAVGVPVGNQPIRVRAHSLAPWRGTCEVVAGATVAVSVVLAAGVTCSGIARDETGAVVAGASIRCGDHGEFLQWRTTSAADGTFGLVGLPGDGFELRAEKKGVGRAVVQLHGAAGTTVRCELQLGRGIVLRGRIVDESGQPVAGVQVTCHDEPNPIWMAFATSDEEGRFTADNCPAGKTLSLRLTKKGHDPVQERGVEPRTEEIEFCMPRDTAVRARIVGRLLGPDASPPPPGTTVQALRSSPSLGHTTSRFEADGSFVIEVPPGRFSVVTDSVRHPAVRAGSRELAAGALWDVGTLQLSRGGTIVLRELGELKAHYLVLDGEERFVFGLYTPQPPLRSGLLAPGEHLLLVRGPGVAAHTVPFSVRADAEVEVEVQPKPGVRQRIEFAPAAPAVQELRSLDVEVRRGGGLVTLSHAERREPGAASTTEVWLAPGDYVLRTREREPATEVAFTVGTSEGPPLRVAVR